MKDIWGFLLQTVNISAIAAVILILKSLLKDKLPPRWQYHVWYLLAVCMVIPVGTAGGVLLPQLHLRIQSLKITVETSLSSAFTRPFVPVYNVSVLPLVQGMPSGITDWLMAIYSVGIAVMVLKYVNNYIALKKIVSRAQPADSDTNQLVCATAQKYGLALCPVSVIDGISSAFVTGIKNPCLILPRNKHTDEKVILHELLHLKHHDLWQNMLWALLFTLHWPNPFMHRVLAVIHNDMESLCDQRVLELLDGEERREYGRILLSMANEKYQSAFGTTSISNGGRFIAQRIQAIAHFRKYPKGVELVSACMVVVLLPNLIAGNSMKYPDDSTHNSLTAKNIAQAILIKHPTPYAAIDTYINGLRQNSRLYQLSVMPQGSLSEYKENLIYSEENIFTGNTAMFSYYILNMAQQADDTYTADIAIINCHPAQSVMGDKYGVLHYQDGTVKQLFETDGELTAEQNRIMREEMSARYADITIIPVKIIRQYGWKIQPADEIQHIKNHRYKYNSDLSLCQLDGIYPRKTVRADLADGTLTAEILPVTAVSYDNAVTNSWYSVKINCTFDENAVPQKSVGMLIDDMSSPSVKSDLDNLINDAVWEENSSTLFSFSGTDYGSRLICRATELENNGVTVYYTTFDDDSGAAFSLTDTTGIGIAVIKDGAKTATIILDLQAGEIYEAK